MSVVPSCRANEMRPDDIQEMCKSKNIPIDKLSDLNKVGTVFTLAFA